MHGPDQSLSIVIGTKDREDSLIRCLRSIAGQTRLPDEVLIVDDGRLDRGRVLGALDGTGVAVRYFNKSHDRGLTKSRNLGIRESRGDVVMFLDDDVVLDRQYLAAIMEVYRGRPEVGGVGGRLVSGRLSPAKRWFLRFFLLDSKREGAVLANGIGVLVRDIDRLTPVQWLSGCNMSFRRRVFDDGMFDENFAGNGWGDDRDFSYRVSRRHPMLATPDARIDHLEEPAGRQSSLVFGRTEIAYMYRFFVKHMPRRPANWLALGWAFVGIALHNVVALRPGRVAGNLTGISEAIRVTLFPRSSVRS